MFNNTTYYIKGDTNNQKCIVNLNTPSTGFIQKSNPVSRFIRFQRGSEIEKKLFPTDPRKEPVLTYEESVWKRVYNGHGDEDLVRSHYEPVIKEEKVTILQVCIFGDDYMLAEYVFDKDLE